MIPLKRLLLITLLLTITFTLSACNQSKVLENPYFENMEEQTWEETEELFVSYMFKVKTHYETYTKHGDLRPDINNYINYEAPLYVTKDTITREDFNNYSLSNDLDYMHQSNLFYIYDSLEDIVALLKDHCSEVDEGEICTHESSAFGFHKEGWNLYVHYIQNRNNDNKIVSDLYFTRNEDNQVTLEGRFEIYQGSNNTVKEYKTVTWIEEVSESNETIIRNSDTLTYDTSTYIKTDYDVERDIYTYFTQNNLYEISGYKDPFFGFYQEIKWVYLDMDFSDYVFALYKDDTLAYRYQEEDSSLFINLMQFQSWDEIKKEGSIYNLYNDNQKLVSKPIGFITDVKSEYPYLHYKGSVDGDTAYFEEVNTLSPALNLDNFMSARTDFILEYAGFRNYVTANRTLEESFNLVIDKFQEEESK